MIFNKTTIHQDQRTVMLITMFVLEYVVKLLSERCALNASSKGHNVRYRYH